jgi:hypothetical protein
MYSAWDRGVGRLALDWQTDVRRRPAETVLYRLVQEHLATFPAVSDDGTGGGFSLDASVRIAADDTETGSSCSPSWARVTVQIPIGSMGFVPLPILQLLVVSVGWVERSETHHGAERGGLNGYVLALWGRGGDDRLHHRRPRSPSHKAAHVDGWSVLGHVA